MTMSNPVRTVAAGVFKAKCLALLDEIARTGVPVIITKRGKPVARVGPIQETPPVRLKGSVLHETDLISPIDVTWNANE